MNLRSIRTYIDSLQSENDGNKDHEVKSIFSPLLSHIRTPLFLNGYALVASALGTAGFGMIYWILAAHLYPAEIVGLNSAAISAMLLLAGLSQLNLNNIMIRFVRTTGLRAKRFTVLIYTIGIAIAVISGIVFLLEIDRWTPELSFIKSNLFLSIWFLISVVSWSIFSLQDGTLTGLRYATWVPIKNTIHSLAKIVFMILMATTVPLLGIFLGWTLAGVILMIPTGYFLIKFLLPKQSRSQEKSLQKDISPKVIKFMIADNVGGLSWIICTYLLPVIVATRVGPAANAYYFLSWTIANTIFLITPNIGYSFVVEASAQPENLRSDLIRVFKQVGRLVIPLALMIIAGAPIILKIFGNNYSQEGSFILRLLALATIPNIIVSLFISSARVQQHRNALLITQLASSFSILGMSFIFLPKFGIIGIGYAYLASQTTIAVIILLSRGRAILAKDIFPDNMSGKTLSTPGRFHHPGKSKLLVAYKHYLMSVHQMKIRLRARKQAQKISAILPGILQTIPVHESHPQPETWRNIYPVPTVNDQQVFFIGPPGQLPFAAMKVSISQKAVRAIKNEVEIIESLQNDFRLSGWNGLVPRILIKGQISNQFYLVEGILPGVTAAKLLVDGSDRTRISKPAIIRISQFHQRTAIAREIDFADFQRWVYQPISVIKRVTTNAFVRNRLDIIENLLAMELLGRYAHLSRIHGDFAPGNILMTRDGQSVTGIVDWELSEKENLPMIDIYMLLLSSKMILEKRELGDLVSAIILGEEWTSAEKALIDYAKQFQRGDEFSQDSLLLLLWLHHVATNISKSSRYQRQKRWISDNIYPVIELFEAIQDTGIKEKRS